MTKHEQATIKPHGIKPFAEAVADLLDEMKSKEHIVEVPTATLNEDGRFVITERNTSKH